jgi:hypothetical protein
MENNPNALQRVPANASGGGFREINGAMYCLKPRFYVVNITHDAVASSNVTGQFQVDPGIPFLCVGLDVHDTQDEVNALAATPLMYPNLLTIRDQRQNYSWNNLPIPRTAFAHDDAHGRLFTDEVYIEGATQINVIAQNPAVAPAVGTTTITFMGWALYSV